MAAEVIQSLIIKELRIGAYVSGSATDSTGYIIVKDSSGTDRKLMIQA